MGTRLSGQEQDPLEETVIVPKATAVPVEAPGMLAPNFHKQTNAGTKSTLLHSLDGAGVLAEDPLFQKVDPSTKGVKRERLALSTELEDGAEALKRRSSTVLVGLQETVALAVLKAGEEWNASICANKSMQEGLLDRIEAGEKRVTAILKVQRDLFKSIDALKKEVSALHQERRVLISKTDAQEEMERDLLNEHQKVLDEFGAEKESLTKLLQESEREVGVRKERELVLLQERQAYIEEIRALQQEKKQNFLLANKLQGNKISCPRTTQCQEMPTTLAVSKEDAEKMLFRARDALSEAAKTVKIDQIKVEKMISYYREGVLDQVLGRTKVASETTAALPDPPDETQIMEQQRQK